MALATGEAAGTAAASSQLAELEVARCRAEASLQTLAAEFRAYQAQKQQEVAELAARAHQLLAASAAAAAAAGDVEAGRPRRGKRTGQAAVTRPGVRRPRARPGEELAATGRTHGDGRPVSGPRSGSGSAAAAAAAGAAAARLAGQALAVAGGAAGWGPEVGALCAAREAEGTQAALREAHFERLLRCKAEEECEGLRGEVAQLRARLKAAQKEAAALREAGEEGGSEAGARRVMGLREL